MKSKTRRSFIKDTSLALASVPVIQTMPDYRRILGANDRVRVGVVGLNGRGAVLTSILLESEGFEVAALRDVDNRTIAKQLGAVRLKQSSVPKTFKDFREMLNDPSVDAVVIASADHTHGYVRGSMSTWRSLCVFVRRKVSSSSAQTSQPKANCRLATSRDPRPLHKRQLQ
jgi:hypothetical protein